MERKPKGVLAAAAATFLLAACGGSGESEPTPGRDKATDYVALLKHSYTPVHDRFQATVSPCLAGEYRLCARRGRHGRAAAERFLDEFAKVDPPEQASSANSRLRKGVTALAAAYVAQERAISAQDDPAFDESVAAVTVAIGEIDAAIYELNDLFPSADLPTVH